MKIILLLVGKTSFSFIEKGMSVYSERLSHYTNFKILEIAQPKFSSSLPVEQLREKEGEMILKNIGGQDLLFLLDENGQEFSSLEFAAFVEKKTVYSSKNIIFVVGGAYGFSNEVYMRADAKISLSKMTYSHQLVRVVFLEQLYRAFTIIKGEPYHHV